MKLDDYFLRIDQLELPARIGVYPEEYQSPQTIRLDIILTVSLQDCDLDSTEGVPCYATISQKIAEILLQEHTPLCEQLAQKIALVCFEDARIADAEISLLKPRALPNAEVGVTMHFSR